MLGTLQWLVAVEVIGVAFLPLAWWLLRALPDHGLAFAKPLGLLLVGYVIWLASSFGILASGRPTTVVVILVAGVVVWVKFGRDFWRWLGTNRGLLLVGEAVFLVAFLAAALLRAYNPQIMGTEKPMDFAFFNAIARADRMPPQDPWLAGYSISYYYFGYFLLATVTRLAGIATAIGFNLSLAFLFGLVAAGAYSLVYNLIAGKAEQTGDGRVGAAKYALLGPLFVGLLANLEGLLEVLHSNALLPLSFWRWLGISGLTSVPRTPALLPTDPPDVWWWWRASRVVGSVNPTTGAATDYTINEFPFFSFMLGDLHPHVMALPFVLLALALALSLVRERERVSLAWFRHRPARSALFVVTFGALGFLNSWDLPTFLFVLAGAYALARTRGEGVGVGRLVQEGIKFGLLALVLAVVAYFPFYLGLRSQVGGIGLVEIRTSPQQFLVFWGPLLVTAVALPLSLANLWWRGENRWALAAGLTFALMVFAMLSGLGAGTLALILTVLVLAFLALQHGLAVREAPAERGLTSPVLVGTSGRVPLQGSDAVLPAGGQPGPSSLPNVECASEDKGPRKLGEEDLLVLGFMVTALLLLAVCEVLFVRDGFGNRMNTVFKLYYQAWVLLAVVAAYTIYYAGRRGRAVGASLVPRFASGTWRGLVRVLLACGLIYTVLAPYSKSGQFANAPTLDGLAWLRAGNGLEASAIAWLSQQDGLPVIAEASGAEYSNFNQASAFTGLPSVLGWAGHEYQWRGKTAEPAIRKADLDTLYQTTDTKVAQQIISKYGITYVYVGGPERQAYAQAPVGALKKFARFMDVAYSNPRVTIYKVRPATSG